MMLRKLRDCCLVLGLCGCAHALPPTLQPGGIDTATTSDGWQLDLRHYPALGPPVLLVHGMGANHGLGHRLGRIALHWARPWRG